MFSAHNRINPETNNRNMKEKSPNTWKLNNTPLHNHCVKEEVSREIRKYFQLTNMKIQKSESTGCS